MSPFTCLKVDIFKYLTQGRTFVQSRGPSVEKSVEVSLEAGCRTVLLIKVPGRSILLSVSALWCLFTQDGRAVAEEVLKTHNFR